MYKIREKLQKHVTYLENWHKNYSPSHIFFTKTTIALVALAIEVVKYIWFYYIFLQCAIFVCLLDSLRISSLLLKCDLSITRKWQ